MEEEGIEDGGAGQEVHDGEHPQGEQAGAQAQQREDGEAGSAPQVSAPDFSKALAEKDALIAELRGKVEEAARTAEATKALHDEIEGLKATIADERVGFALKAAGCRSEKAARALLGDFGGDVGKLKDAEPWLFGDGGKPAGGGATGLEPAGAAGGGPEAQMRRWERIAGLADG